LKLKRGEFNLGGGEYLGRRGCTKLRTSGKWGVKAVKTDTETGEGAILRAFYKRGHVKEGGGSPKKCFAHNMTSPSGKKKYQGKKEEPKNPSSPGWYISDSIQQQQKGLLRRKGKRRGINLSGGVHRGGISARMVSYSGVSMKTEGGRGRGLKKPKTVKSLVHRVPPE